jgi:hypothetical protein
MLLRYPVLKRSGEPEMTEEAAIPTPGDAEVVLPGGNVGGAVRVVATVRRPTGPYDVLADAIRWLREYHRLVASYRPVGELVWRAGTAVLGAGEIVRDRCRLLSLLAFLAFLLRALPGFGLASLPGDGVNWHTFSATVNHCPCNDR